MAEKVWARLESPTGSPPSRKSTLAFEGPFAWSLSLSVCQGRRSSRATARPCSGTQADLPEQDPVTSQQQLRNKHSLCLPPSAYFLCLVNIEK